MGVGWCSGARNGSQVAMGRPQEPSDRSGRLTADGVISDAGLAASPARTAPHTSEGGHGYVSLLGPAARRAGVDLSTPGWTRFAHSLAPEDRLCLAADGGHSGTLRGDLTVALDGLGGCLSRFRLEGRSTGVGWCSGARNGSQVAMGGPQEPSDRSGRFTADGVSSDAGLADLWQARPCNGQLTAAVMSPIAARRHGARGCTSRHLGRLASLILGAPRPPLPRRRRPRLGHFAWRSHGGPGRPRRVPLAPLAGGPVDGCPMVLRRA